MSTVNISDIVTSLLALSLASERFTEVVKGTVPFLCQENSDPAKERLRTTLMRVIAGVGGVSSAWLAHAAMGEFVNNLWNNGWPGMLALGLLTSGGSGLWSAALKYVGAVKDLKVAERETKASPQEGQHEAARDRNPQAQPQLNLAGSK